MHGKRRGLHQIRLADQGEKRHAELRFLGLDGESRRAEILSTYELLFQQRLPALLARLADKPLAVIGAPLPVLRKERIKESHQRRRATNLATLGVSLSTPVRSRSPAGSRS